MISDYDRANVADIMAGEGDWFTAQMLRLCQKADAENLARIRLGFPEIVALYEDWFSSRI